MMGGGRGCQAALEEERRQTDRPSGGGGSHPTRQGGVVRLRPLTFPKPRPHACLLPPISSKQETPDIVQDS